MWLPGTSDLAWQPWEHECSNAEVCVEALSFEPPVRAAPQPQSCSVIPHLPCSKTAAQGEAGKDQSETLCPTFSAYKTHPSFYFP